MLKGYGSLHDVVDENGQTALFYAIKANKVELIEYLLSLGCNVNIVDKRGLTPINFAIRHNKHHLKEILIKYGANPPADSKNKKAEPKKAAQVAQPKVKTNERLLPKEYVL
jgi:ankyrin repeat protein